MTKKRFKLKILLSALYATYSNLPFGFYTKYKAKIHELQNYKKLFTKNSIIRRLTQSNS